MVYTALFLENLYTFVKICTPFMALTDSEIKLSILSKSLHINKNTKLLMWVLFPSKFLHVSDKWFVYNDLIFQVLYALKYFIDVWSISWVFQNFYTFLIFFKFIDE